MRNLKTILGIIYPILILLLILLNLKSCGPGEPPGEPLIPRSDSTSTRPVVDSTTIRQVSEIGGMGDLKITLLWDFYADIDLHVKQPNGKIIYYGDKKDNHTGGYLDVDNRRGGTGSAENIYWKHPDAGRYEVRLVYYGNSLVNNVASSGICTVVVMHKGEAMGKYEVPMNRVGQQKTVVTFTI